MGCTWIGSNLYAQSRATVTHLRRALRLIQAAESKARGDVTQALGAIIAIRAQDPQHAQAHFAAGQLHVELQQWALAEEAYVAAASLEPDLAQRARCWLGTGELPTQRLFEHTVK